MHNFLVFDIIPVKSVKKRRAAIPKGTAKTAKTIVAMQEETDLVEVHVLNLKTIYHGIIPETAQSGCFLIFCI